MLVVAAVAASAAGLRAFDAAVGGLGGCPYTHLFSYLDLSLRFPALAWLCCDSNSMSVYKTAHDPPGVIIPFPCARECTDI